MCLCKFLFNVDATLLILYEIGIESVQEIVKKMTPKKLQGSVLALHLQLESSLRRLKIQKTDFLMMIRETDFLMMKLIFLFDFSSFHVVLLPLKVDMFFI